MTIAIALMDPLVAIDGIRMGCADENDDHLLEVDVKAGATFVVSRDQDSLDLPSDARVRLEAHGDLTVLRVDYFCGIVRERLARGLTRGSTISLK